MTGIRCELLKHCLKETYALTMLVATVRFGLV